MLSSARPQPINAPAPESFLPTFDFEARPKTRPAAPVTPRKQVPLAKRLAAFTFLNLEDIVEEGDDGERHPARGASSPNPLSPSAGGNKASRILGFTRGKNATPIKSAPLPPMASKAYATLVGGPAAPGSRPAFPSPPSKVIRPAVSPMNSDFDAPTVHTKASRGSVGSTDGKEDPKSLAVDLVSIFSVSTSEETDAHNARFSFPMPPNFTPRRGSQSPLDPELSFNAIQSPLSPLSPDSVGSGGSDGSFFSPLFSAGFATPRFPSDAVMALNEGIPPVPQVSKPTTEQPETKSKRPVLSLIPPPLPPPRISPPPTPSDVSGSPQSTSRMDLIASAAKRACPSPDLDPELSAASSASAIASALMRSGTESSTDERSDDDEARDKVNIFGDWELGAPSRSGSIITLTQRAFNSAIRRGSFSTVDAAGTRNGSVGSDHMYDNWEQAIDDIFSLGLASRKPSLTQSRKPSLTSIALAASAEGAASANFSLDVVEDTAFVMDEEMLRKLTESQFLVASRDAPSPPSPLSRAQSPCPSASTTSLASTLSTSVDATSSAPATSSARSSLDDGSSTGHGMALDHELLTPILEEHLSLHTDATLLTRPAKQKPAPVIRSENYPPVAGLRINKAERPRVSTNAVRSVPLPPRPQRPVPVIPPERPPPSQSIPDETNFFSPIYPSGGISSPSQPVDIDSWPAWSTIDVAMETKRVSRRSSAGAMSKFSDDSVEVGRPRKHSGAKVRTPTGPNKPEASEEPVPGRRRMRKNGMSSKANLSPNSSHMSYAFLGLKKRKETPSPTVSPTEAYGGVRFSPKETRPRTSSESNKSEPSSDGGKKNGLKRPPLPLELFIRA